MLIAVAIDWFDSALRVAKDMVCHTNEFSPEFWKVIPDMLTVLADCALEFAPGIIHYTQIIENMIKFTYVI